MPNNLKLDFVLIDGPPGNRFGREATLYQIAPYLSSSTLICLDDANRRPEKEALANWRRVWRNGMDVVHFPELKKGFAVIQLKDPSITSRCPFDFSDIVLSRLRAINALIREKKRRLRREG